DVAAEDIHSQLAIKRSALQEMSDEIVAIGRYRSVRKRFPAMQQALVHVPVGGIDGDVADAVTAFFEKSAKLVALFGRVALFQKWIAEVRTAIAVRRYNLFIL